MSFEFIFIKVIHSFPIYYGVFVTMAMAVMGQLHSPCPETFQYDRYPNGELYGKISVSADQNVVDLIVQLSVPNYIEGDYEGFINLTIPRSQAADNIRKGRPILYSVYFPPWTSQPPRVTRIKLNGRTICSGVPFEPSRKIPVVSNVSLNTRFSSNKVAAEGSQNQNPNQTIDLGEANSIYFVISTTKRTTTVTGPLPWETSNEDDFDFPPAQVTKPRPPPPKPTPNRPNWTPTQPDWTPSRPKPTPIQSKPTPTQPDTPPPTQSEPPPTPPKLIPTQPKPTQTSPELENKSPLSTEKVCGTTLPADTLLFTYEGVKSGTFPWLVAIFTSTRRNAEYKCCGSLVSQKHVITAAHCLQEDPQKISPIPADKFFFIFGKHTIRTIVIEEGEKMVYGEEIKTHPEYVPLSSDADIAVVILAEQIKFTDLIKPICIWSESNDIEAIVGHDGKVVWWGNDDEPKQATLKIVSQNQCAKSARSFCAGGESNVDACYGNSGSGFVMQRHRRWNLRGIVSIAVNDADRKSCDSNNYVVYTDVSKFETWLLSIITI